MLNSSGEFLAFSAVLVPTARLLKGRGKGRELLVVGKNNLFTALKVTPGQRSQRYSRAIRPGFQSLPKEAMIVSWSLQFLADFLKKP